MRRCLAGVIGGSGPVATSDFFRHVNQLCQQKYNAEQDTDYPDLLIYNKPLRGFDETGIADELLVKKDLLEAVAKLCNAKVDFLVMPCNTLHAYTPEIRKQSMIPFYSLIEIAVEEAKDNNIERLGIVSSSTTRSLGLYKMECEKNNIQCIKVNNEDQKKLDELILLTMSGKVDEIEKRILRNICQNLMNKGAEAVVLGCTELPLILNAQKEALPLYDTLYLLAKKTAEEALCCSQ